MPSDSGNDSPLLATLVHLYVAEAASNPAPLLQLAGVSDSATDLVIAELRTSPLPFLSRPCVVAALAQLLPYMLGEEARRMAQVLCCLISTGHLDSEPQEASGVEVPVSQILLNAAVMITASRLELEPKSSCDLESGADGESHLAAVLLPALQILAKSAGEGGAWSEAESVDEGVGSVAEGGILAEAGTLSEGAEHEGRIGKSDGSAVQSLTLMAAQVCSTMRVSPPVLNDALSVFLLHLLASLGGAPSAQLQDVHVFALRSAITHLQDSDIKATAMKKLQDIDVTLSSSPSQVQTKLC